jgi:CheY-like chemotaxis protein
MHGWVTSAQQPTKACMSAFSKHRVLVVDDEPSIREVVARSLTLRGYEVATAKHGFDALLLLRRDIPDVIISDLNMPNMSGFEFLSVVRRRFPQISVIAMSGAYRGNTVPGGVIADAFYAKGMAHLETLFCSVGDLIRTAAERADAHELESAPVWIPRNGKDTHGVPYIVVTCTECLRSFPLNVTEETLPQILETQCLFCPNTVRYIIDFSLSVSSPPKQIELGAPTEKAS